MAGPSHQQLCGAGVRWLRRPFSAGGHGCAVAVSECRASMVGGEIPDAIGFRFAGHFDGTVVVEAKASRADFLADRHKPHRAFGGMGNWRYYIAPIDLIAVDELPARWGLIEVNTRLQIKRVHGAAPSLASWHTQDEVMAWRHEANTTAELALLTRLMARVGDHEALNRRLAETNARYANLVRRYEAEQVEVRRLRAENFVLQMQECP